MAQIPKGRLVKGQCKPICRDCAMYFSLYTIIVQFWHPSKLANNLSLVWDWRWFHLFWVKKRYHVLHQTANSWNKTRYLVSGYSNNHGDRKSPNSGKVPLPNGIFIAYKWGWSVILTTYKSWDDPPNTYPPSVTSHVEVWGISVR